MTGALAMKTTNGQYPRQGLNLGATSQALNKTWGGEGETLHNDY